jgi:hypothetical protein
MTTQRRLYRATYRRTNPATGRSYVAYLDEVQAGSAQEARRLLHLEDRPDVRIRPVAGSAGGR